MKKEPFADQCSNSTQTMTVDIPFGLVERFEKYAEENDTDISGVIIEALDTFLRGETIAEFNCQSNSFCKI